MAMRKAFTGGACAPGGDGQTMGNNAFTNMMDYMISGGASAAQKAEGYGPQTDMANMNAMEAAFAEQEKMEAMNQQFGSMQMNQHPSQNMAMPQISQPNMTEMNNLWDNPTTQAPIVKEHEPASKFNNMGHHPGMFGLPGMMGPMMHGPMHSPMTMNQPAMSKEEVKVEEVPEVVKKDQQLHNDEIKEVSATIIEQLNRVPSQKMQNSQFLQFMKKLNTGAYEVKDNGLVEDPQKMKEFNEKEANMRQMDAEWFKNKIDAIIEETKDPEYFKEEDAIKQKNFEDFDPTNLFRDVWDAGELDEGELQRMMKSWKDQAEKSMGYYDEVIDQPPVETIIQVPKVDHFKFEENNPYDGVDDAYTLALQLNDELKVHDAVLALKAHLTKEPDHAASWRLLGQLYQEKDEDDKAIAYFKKAYELDPYDWDSLLCLGVSLTNELNPRVAMNHLMDWLRYNPEYWDLPIPSEPILDEDALRGELKNLFMQALGKNPDDVEVLIWLGILAFGERDYASAADHFGKAAHQKPDDYNLWNKYGAALANNLQTEDALEVYDKTLSMRPNLVRTWANVGIAYCNKDAYEQAALKFMNALALNPTADHIWKYLHSCFWAEKQFDKCEMVKKRNIELFRGEYDIINPEMLKKS